MNATTRYQIRLKERLDHDWATWLAPMIIQYGSDDETVLTGPLRDQAELHGLLVKLRDLNVTLLALQLVEPADEQSPGEADLQA